MKRMPALFTVLLLITAISQAGAESTPSDLDTHHAALQALQVGNTLEAIDLFSQAIAAAPKDYRYYNDRGVAYRKCGDLKMALADYTRALELKQNYTNALNNRGVVYLQQGDYDKALKDFTEALKHGGLEGTILTNTGMVYARQGDHRSAIREFEKALSHSPIDNRSFLFMAESFEQIGDKDKAFKIYQLALGLIKEPKTSEYIQERITALERTRTAAKQLPKPVTTSVSRPVEQAPVATTAPEHDPAQKGRQSRKILPARPLPPPAGSPKRETPPAHETGVKTLLDLDLRCRSRALEKFSPVSAEIYKQGVQFLEKSDRAKALVRFEDTRQLEKRKKNSHGIAWNNLELGRIYRDMGEHLKATAFLEEALKMFERLKASDETVLTIQAMASNQKAAGRKDKADAYYKKAVEQATASGHHLLAAAIGDEAAGKAPAPEQQAIVEHKPVETAQVPPQISARSTSAPQTPPQMGPVLAQAAPPSSPDASRQEQSRRTQPGGQADGLAKVGRGPLTWSESGKIKRPVRPVTPALPAGSVISSPPKTAQVKTQTERQVSSAPGSGTSLKALLPDKRPGITSPAAAKHPVAQQPAQQRTVAPESYAPGIQQTKEIPPFKDKRSAMRKREDERHIREDLTQLNRLRQTEDEHRMIHVLERLADRYIKSGEYEKALHCFIASAGFREKLVIVTGTDKVLAQRGLLRQKLGKPVEALEDFTQASSLSDRGQGASRRALEDRAQKLAAEMGLDAPVVLRAYKALWQAREAGDGQAETHALLLVGKLYDKARRLSQALDYYERSSASMLADKARIYEKMGRKEQAELSFNQALETFKKLDYSRYLRMMRKTGTPESLSRR